jgi:hypothetical protein
MIRSWGWIRGGRLEGYADAAGSKRSAVVGELEPAGVLYVR